jgi:hypothetical protein
MLRLFMAPGFECGSPRGNRADRLRINRVEIRIRMERALEATMLDEDFQVY